MSPIRRPLWLAALIFLALASLALAIYTLRSTGPSVPVAQEARDRA